MKIHWRTGLRTEEHLSESFDALQERIRVRAYQLYEQRGREDGHEFENWLQTESEEIGEKVKKVAAEPA